MEALIAEVHSLEVSSSLQAARDRLTRVIDTLDREPSLVQELERIDAALEAARHDALREEREWQSNWQGGSAAPEMAAGLSGRMESAASFEQPAPQYLEPAAPLPMTRLYDPSGGRRKRRVAIMAAAFTALLLRGRGGLVSVRSGQAEIGGTGAHGGDCHAGSR